jgi:hypothetical protein
VEGYFQVAAGTVLSVTVGQGGAEGINAGRGGDTSVGNLATAGGANAGGAGAGTNVGVGSTFPGVWALGSALVGNANLAAGLGGQNGIVTGGVLISGQGGGANGGCGALSASGTSAVNLSGLSANTPGAGGSGGIGTGAGGNGAAGQVIIEW